MTVKLLNRFSLFYNAYVFYTRICLLDVKLSEDGLKKIGTCRSLD